MCPAAVLWFVMAGFVRSRVSRRRACRELEIPAVLQTMIRINLPPTAIIFLRGMQ
jgi:hypothetical protein